MSEYTEDHLIEQPAIQLMEHDIGLELGERLRRVGWRF